jgi:hypothetical protein
LKSELNEGYCAGASASVAPYGLGVEEMIQKLAVNQLVYTTTRSFEDVVKAFETVVDTLAGPSRWRLGEIETALAVFGNRPVRYDSAEIPRAGAFVSPDPDGRLTVARGYVRPEDEPTPAANGDSAEEEVHGSDATALAAPAAQRAVITIGGEKPDDDGDDDAIKPLPERLVGELTAHRNLALRDAVANNPHVAMTALFHKLCLDTFQHSALRVP